MLCKVHKILIKNYHVLKEPLKFTLLIVMQVSKEIFFIYNFILKFIHWFQFFFFRKKNLKKVFFRKKTEQLICRNVKYCRRNLNLLQFNWPYHVVVLFRSSDLNLGFWKILWRGLFVWGKVCVKVGGERCFH